MSTEISGIIEAELTLTLFKADPLGTPNDPYCNKPTWSIQHGTGAGQADLLWSDARKLGPGAAGEELDIVGSLTDEFGAAFSPARLKAFIVINPARNSAPIRIENAASAPFLGILPAGSVMDVYPNGIFCMVKDDADGWPLSAGTNDRIKFQYDGGGGFMLYQVILVAASA